jgi:poly-gamma-glutamate capsule biosynthesis protein CapA/YwtB (metallophosphatase superfamily)
MLALITLFLCGDVMTGRGIDQMLPKSNDPILYEPSVKDAREYVALAERKNGPIPKRVDYRYLWGDALEVLHEIRPDASIVNLETSVTTSDANWNAKMIHYRMHPENVEFLNVASIDCCVLGNNHVLDWGYSGLDETIATIRAQGIAIAGVGTAEEAAAPAVLETARGRVMVFSYATTSSGVPRSWAAKSELSGVNLLSDLSDQTAGKVVSHIQERTRPDDVVIFSVHWGSNWGYHVPEEQVRFAHLLVDSGAVDIVHGHSSHHVRPLEVYRGKLLLYGCGDFLNDYEGITGYEDFRDDLTLMYFPRLDVRTGNLVTLEMVPLQIRNFGLHRTSAEDARWVRDTLRRESANQFADIDMGLRNNFLELRVSSESDDRP